MRRLTLRARLVLAVVVILAVQVVAAFVVISIASDELLDRVDERLNAAVSGGTEPEDLGRITDLYQGTLGEDGQLVTLNELRERGKPVPPPELGPGDVERASRKAITVEAERGQVEYRVVAIGSPGGETLVIGNSLDGFEWTMDRLKRLVAITAGLIAVVLVAVMWWVLRLGVDPMKRMTTTAEAIAAGDLSERIDVADPRSEAGQLGIALNTMMGHIERSFEEQIRAEARLRQFVADASHELRTPVATIRGYAELYQAGGLAEQASLDDAMQRTSQESERMSRLIADMLRLANLDREPDVSREPVDLTSIVREVVSDASAAHEHRSIETDLDSVSLVVRGDEDLLRQAVANLVSNAVVHTDAGAIVRVGAKPSVRSGAVTVAVTDNGPGMTDDVVQHATERFFRADPSRSRHKGGSGLGLAIVAGIVEAHNGELQIESVPGKGTTVTLELPVHDGDSQQVLS